MTNILNNNIVKLHLVFLLEILIIAIYLNNLRFILLPSLMVVVFSFFLIDRGFKLRKSAISLLVLVSIIYIGYYFLHLVTINGEFQYILFNDQQTFFETANELSKLNIIKSIQYCFIDRIHIEQEGAYFYFSLISRISDVLLGSDYFYTHQFFVLIVALGIVVILNKILYIQTNDKYAFCACLMFSVLSYNLIYSTFLLRDLHIAFFYTLFFYFYLKQSSIINIIVMLLIMFITTEFRLENGVYMLSLFLAYIICSIKNKRARNIFLVLSIIILFCVLFFILEYLQPIIDGLQNYRNATEDQLSKSGLASQLYRLPVGFREVSIILFSQITPFPFWVSFDLDTFNDNFYFAIFHLIYPIYWFCVFNAFLIYIIKFIRQLNLKDCFVIIFILVYLILNTNSMDIRRLFCIYPMIVYLTSSLHYKYHYINLRKFIYINLFIYFTLCLLYIIVKN